MEKTFDASSLQRRVNKPAYDCRGIASQGSDPVQSPKEDPFEVLERRDAQASPVDVKQTTVK